MVEVSEVEEEAGEEEEAAEAVVGDTEHVQPFTLCTASRIPRISFKHRECAQTAVGKHCHKLFAR